jgi:hypothetical protein
VRLERGDVLVRVGIPLLAVETGDERLIQMFGPGVRQLIQHPRLIHRSSLAAAATE